MIRASKRIGGAIIKIWNEAVELYEVFSNRGYRFEGVEDADGNLYGPDDLSEYVTEMISGEISEARKWLQEVGGGISVHHDKGVRLEKPKDTKYFENASVATLRVMAQSLNIPNYKDLRKKELKAAIKKTKGLIQEE